MDIQFIVQDEIHSDYLEIFYSCWENFFESDDKNYYLGDLSYPIGYFGLIKNEQSSYHEDFYYYPESHLCPSELRSISNYLFLKLQNLALQLIENTKDWRWLKEKEIRFLMRVLYYHQEKSELMNFPHEDKSYFTILPKPTQSGLQYFYQNKWIDIEYQERQLLVLAGNKSSSLMKPVLHRVISNQSQTKRLAVAFFIS